MGRGRLVQESFSFHIVKLWAGGWIVFQGIEKKRSTLHGSEKGVVARHEVGHAVVGTAVANLLPSQARVEVFHNTAPKFFES